MIILIELSRKDQFPRTFGPLLDFIMKFSDNNDVLFFYCEQNSHYLFQFDKTLVTKLTFLVNFIRLLIYPFQINLFLLILLPI